MVRLTARLLGKSGAGVLVLCCLLLTVGYAAEEADNAPRTVNLLEISSIPVPGYYGFALPTEVKAKEAVPSDRMPSALVGQYDLTRDAGKVLRYARVMVYQEQRDLGLIADTFQLLGRSPQVINMLSPLAKSAITQSLESNGGQVLEMYPVTQINIGNKPAVNIAARVIASEKLPIPLYLQAFLFTQERKLTGVAYLCTDGDREFWQPMLQKAVQEMR